MWYVDCGLTQYGISPTFVEVELPDCGCRTLLVVGAHVQLEHPLPVTVSDSFVVAPVLHRVNAVTHSLPCSLAIQQSVCQRLPPTCTIACDVHEQWEVSG